MNVKDFRKRRILRLSISSVYYRKIFTPNFIPLLFFLILFSGFPALSITSTISIDNLAVVTNSPPVAVTDLITTNEDTPKSGNVLTNDHDPEGAPLHVVAETKATSHGNVTLKADGSFTYTPNANYNGNDTFTYKVCDNASPNGCCSGTVKVTILPVQDAPIGNPDFFTTNEDTPLVVTCDCVIKNDVDPDGQPITAVLGKPTTHGTIVLKPDGSFTYTPDHDFNGKDTFTYYANDGIANSNETVVTITVVPVNDAPVAANDEITTNEDTPVTIPILSNDTDVDDVLIGSMITLVTNPAHGTLVINANGTVTYTPALNYSGSDSFTYKIKDSCGAFSGVATVKITVVPVNDAPIAGADAATTPEEVPVLIGVLLNDTDVDNALNPTSVTVVTAPSHGTAVVEASTGKILYTPQKDFYGNDSFTYTVKDIAGAASVPATVTVVVTPVNDAPVSLDDQATTPENTAVDIPVLSNDFDVDNTIVISSLKITSSPLHGTVVVNPSSGVVTYTPAKDFVGDDSFKYTIQDAGGLVSSPATVSINVFHVNLPPVAVDDELVHEVILPVTIDVMANDYDPDNTHDELSIVSVTQPNIGSVTIVDGKVVYQPEGTSSVTVTFTYKITDPEGLTDEATVTIEYVFKNLIVSQGFSPNGDGNNDTWYIQGIESYPNNLVKVFDRWGLLVYQKEHYENTIAPWDGRGNIGQQAGKLLDRGTYFYVLEPGSGLKELSGYVVIIR